MRNFIEEHTIGIAATLVFHILIVMVMNVWYLESTAGNDKEDLVDIVLDTEELEKILKLSEAAYEKVSAEDVTTGFKNLSVKERLERGKEVRLNKAAEKWTDEQVRKELEELERSEFDRLAEERDPIAEIEPKRSEEKMQEGETQDVSSDPGSIIGPATVTCDLSGRTEVGRVYIPAYLCRGQGKVVIRITVDRQGKVEQAKLDPSISTSQLNCHLKFAQEAASRTQFNRNPNSPAHQKGTITYIFLAQ